MLSAYHEKYRSESDEKIAFRARVKDMQLRQIFAVVGAPILTSPTVKIAVLGCADRRLVAHHRRMFESLFSKPVEMTTFDIATEHLEGESGVVRHDATTPLPGGPFDVVYADVLVRFVDPSKQFSILSNAHDALAPGGVAVITFAKEDFDPPPGYVPLEGTYRVDMNALQLGLSRARIAFLEAPTTVEMSPPGSDDKMVIEDLGLVLRRP